MRASVWFVGVSTRESLIHGTFPIWAQILGVDVELRGVDVAIGTTTAGYRRLVERLREDESCRGAVITTHKTSLFVAARDLFASVDPVAMACGEVNAIRRNGRSLAACAKDPVSVGRVVDRIWPAEGAVLCMGSGGTAIALGHHLLNRGLEPARMQFVDRDEGAAARLLRVLAPGRVSVEVGSGPWDERVQALPAGSLVVNATGMGKDRPGSPVTPNVRFPSRSVIWELNYRGDLRMLSLARTQAQDGGLEIHDGWSLFCHGWAAALSAVFDLPDEPTQGDIFSRAARHLRPRT